MTVRTGPSGFPSSVAYFVRRDVAKALEHRAAVLEPAVPGLSCLRPTEFIGPVVVARLLDSDAVFR